MKLLIRLGILVAIMLSSFLGNAQSKSDKIYDMFSGKDGVLTLSFSKSVLKPFEIFIDDDTKKVIYKMKKVRFMTYNEDKGELDAFNVLERILNEFDSREYFKIDPEEFDCEDCDVNIDSNDELYL
ncbi:MAG: hypothetical protein PF541_09410, partial [Prolixibacteraceae bacterium]|nr:hypothetical protein [Prolixibacteraceae bacterium]